MRAPSPAATTMLVLVAATAQTTASGPAPAGLAKATFAGGCFWCVEADFDKVPGVKSTISGYIGGKVANPSYEQVSAKTTGHAEAVEVVFDPKVVSYEQLVDYFWRTIPFYAAEDYHQDYYKKNPVRYKYYRNGCGREERLKQLWGSLPVPPAVTDGTANK